MSSNFLDTLALVQRIVASETRVDEINRFLRDDLDSLRRELGLYALILAYVDPLARRSPLHYLTHNLHWPYSVDDESGNWTPQDDLVKELQYAWASAIRRLETEAGLYCAASNTPQALDALLPDSRAQGPTLSVFERRHGLLFCPMGEVVGGLLGWYLRRFCTTGKGRFLDRLDEPLSEPMEESAMTAAQARFLEEHRSHMHLLPAALRLSAAKRPLWRDVLLELGILRRDGYWSQAVLGRLTDWIVGQVVDRETARPTVPVKLSPKELALLRSVLDGGRGSDRDEQCVELVCTALSRSRTPSLQSWEDAFHFGFGNHLFWQSVGFRGHSAVLAPYDWICFPVLPAAYNEAGGYLLSARGIAFLTIRSNPAGDGTSRLEERLQRIRMLVLTIAPVETRLTYFGKIQRNLERLQNESINLALRRLYHHDFGNGISSIHGFLSSERYEDAGKHVEFLLNLHNWHIDRIDEATKRSDEVAPLGTHLEALISAPHVRQVCSEKKVVWSCLDENVNDIRWAYGDPRLVATATLLENAVRHSPAGATIQTSIERDGPLFLVVTNPVSPEKKVGEPWRDVFALITKKGSGLSVARDALYLAGLSVPEYCADGGLFRVRLVAD